MARIKSPRNNPEVTPTPETVRAVNFQEPAQFPEPAAAAVDLPSTEPVSPKAIKERLERYRPLLYDYVDDVWWARVSPHLVDLVTLAHPRSLSQALGDLQVLAAMAMLAELYDLPIEPVNLLTQEAFIRAKGEIFAGKSVKSINDYESRLVRLAHTHLPGEWPRRRQLQQRKPSGPPTSTVLRQRQYEAAMAMSAPYRRDAETFLDLAYHVFARPDEIRRATGDWVTGRPGDVIVTVTDRYGRRRLVPVVGEAADRLLARAADVGTAPLIRPRQSRKRAHYALAVQFQQANAPFDPFAARKRGLVDLARLAPASVVALLGGLNKGSHGLMEVVADVPAPTHLEAREWIRRVQTSADRRTWKS